MNQAAKFLSVLLIAVMMPIVAPSGAWAESGVPDPDTFFGPLIVNPQAAGTKLSGSVSVAYDREEAAGSDCNSFIVNNMYVVATFERGGTAKPFNRDFTTVSQAPICFDDQGTQVNFVLGLFADNVVPFFFGCSPGTCPGFEVKSVKNFLSSGTGALSLDIVLAVQ